VFGSKFTALIQKSIKGITKNIGTTIIVGIRQGALCNAGESEMIPFMIMASHTNLYVTETVQSFRLSKQKRNDLLPTGEPFDVFVSLKAINTPFEIITRKKLQ